MKMEMVRPGNPGPEGGSDAIASEIRSVVQRVRTPPERAEPSHSEASLATFPGDGGGDA